MSPTFRKGDLFKYQEQPWWLGDRRISFGICLEDSGYRSLGYVMVYNFTEKWSRLTPVIELIKISE